MKRERLTGFECGFPTEKTVGGGGFPKVGEYLLGLATSLRKLRGVCVVVDADDDPAARFASVKKSLERIGCRVERPYEVSDGHPKILVCLLPGVEQSGSLEHLLLKAIFSARPDLEACVDQFAACLAAPLGWKDNDRAKMRLHSLLAGSCQDEPATNLAHAWGKVGCPFAIDSAVFDEMAEAFRLLASACGLPDPPSAMMESA